VLMTILGARAPTDGCVHGQGEGVGE